MNVWTCLGWPGATFNKHEYMSVLEGLVGYQIVVLWRPRRLAKWFTGVMPIDGFSKP